MKRPVLVLIAIIATSNLNAQEVISTSGETYSTPTGSIDFTIGEVVINTVSDGSYDLTQGFHQTNWNFVGLEDHVPEYTATVFPNPTSDVLNIKATVSEDVNYTLFDGMGRIVLQGELTGDLTSLQVSQLAPGNYHLRLSDKAQKDLKTFKLIKQQ